MVRVLRIGLSCFFEDAFYLVDLDGLPEIFELRDIDVLKVATCVKTGLLYF